MIKLKYFLIILICCSLVACFDSDPEPYNTVTILLKDNDVQLIELESCNSIVKVDEHIDKIEFKHQNCDNSNYRLRATYNDGEVLDKTFGYVPGTKSVHHEVVIKERKLVLR